MPDEQVGNGAKAQIIGTQQQDLDEDAQVVITRLPLPPFAAGKQYGPRKSAPPGAAIV